MLRSVNPELKERIDRLAAEGGRTLSAGAAVDMEELPHQLEEIAQRKLEYKLRGSENAGTANAQDEIDKVLARFD